MHPTKQKALQILAEEKHGFLKRCDCSIGPSCERNFPDEATVMWARGVIAGLNATEHHQVTQSEIDWTIKEWRKEVTAALGNLGVPALFQEGDELPKVAEVPLMGGRPEL